MEPQNTEVIASNVEQIDTQPLARKRLISFFTRGLILRGFVWFFLALIVGLTLFGDTGGSKINHYNIYRYIEPVVTITLLLYPIVFIGTFLLGLRALFLQNFADMDKFIKIGSMWRWILIPNILEIIAVSLFRYL
jgi:hypothetical protein